MPFHVNVREDLKPIDLLLFQTEGAAVMYVPAAEPVRREQLELMRLGLRTQLPDGAETRYAESFSTLAYRRAHRAWLDDLATVAAAECPLSADRVAFLLVACVESLAYATAETYVLLDDADGLECEPCLTRVYDACRAKFPHWNLPEHLTVNVVRLPAPATPRQSLPVVHA